MFFSDQFLDINSGNHYFSGSLFVKDLLPETTFCLLWRVFVRIYAVWYVL